MCLKLINAIRFLMQACSSNVQFIFTETHYGHCEMIDIDPEHGLNHVHGDVNFIQVRIK